MNENQSELTYVTSDFPKNRYDALEEAEKLLCFKPFEWECFLRLLQKADGWLSFSHGGISTEWTRYREDDKVHLSFVISTDHVERSAAYSFSLQELTHLKNRKQLRIEDFGSE